MDKIVCVGKNYVEHAKELGDVVPEKPVLFVKPPSVLRHAAGWDTTLSLSLPQDRGAVHYECEIVLILKSGGEKISISEAKKHIEAVAIGLDMTLRTVQGQLKKAGHPWTVAKVFRDAAVVSPSIPVESFPNYLEEPFSLALNGRVCQQARGTEMILSPEEIISYASFNFPLLAGDLIFTGTPAGVGEVKHGDVAKLSWGDRHFSVTWD